MKESLRKTSLDTFKHSPSSYIAVGVMCGLFLILSVLFALIDPLLLVIALPLLAMPFLFASHISCYYLRINQPITISAYFRYFLGFFRSPFRGSFRAIISFLKSLAFYFGSAFIASIVIYFIFKANYGVTFVEGFNKLIYTYVSYAEATYDDVVAVLEENDGLLLTFILYISAFAIPLAMLAFIYYISFSSISIYFRANATFEAGPLLKMSVSNTYSLHRKNMRKDWFMLNWPILVLSLLGMAIFALVDILLVKRLDLLPAFVIIGGVAFLMFYLPLYFTNMETIYLKYEANFKQGNTQAIATILERIQNSIDLSEEEKKSLEESLKGAKQDEEEEQ